MAEVKKRVSHGEIIVIRECLQSIGIYHEICDFFYKQINKIIGNDRTRRLKSAGIEKIHNFIDVEEMIPIADSIKSNFKPQQLRYLEDIVKVCFNYNERFYFCADPIIRIHPPFDYVNSKPGNVPKLKSYGGGGKLGVHDPHTDSMVNCPTNNVNIWIAMGRVNVGNGLNIWPQHYGKHIDNPGGHNVNPNDYLGAPINFSLSSGDIVLFRGEHLHGSNLNWTDETRFSISYRITFETPVFPVGSRQVYLDSETNESLIYDGLDSNAETILYEPTLNDSEKGNLTKTNPSNIDTYIIEPFSGDLAVVNLDNGKRVIISRYCTHEGADLCGGYIRDGNIVCPKHNLPFSLKDGTSPCLTLNSLKIIDAQF